MTLLEAIKILIEDESIGDFIYNVRDRAQNDFNIESKESSWDHPRVKRYSDAVQRLTEELKKEQSSASKK